MAPRKQKLTIRHGFLRGSGIKALKEVSTGKTFLLNDWDSPTPQDGTRDRWVHFEGEPNIPLEFGEKAKIYWEVLDHKSAPQWQEGIVVITGPCLKIVDI